DVSDPNDLDLNTRGLWGGVILLGKARINTTLGEGQIEGIPTTEPRGAYGGNDDNDNSGVVRYVSIRYGGTDIGANNEINGLTFGAVGRGTVVEYVEVFNNKDDGYEWFGGTVRTRYLVSAFNGDDCFDYDEGFRGYGQFWFAIMGEDIGNRAGEHDGGTDPEGG
ncbi:MAG: T9SS C-terminal target domain-containing protein, partial [Calditrichaeota bacterium]|nr:T9SS C-terminal target domain-containing protein [Calditrichota bacterium]